jgi:pyruvate/2-oxoglutarate dehydrogenase complex dihydrolipoamide acyltransferase (E2) component
MSVEIILPKLDFSMAEGTVVEWFVTNGAQARLGAPLYSLESGKAVQEIEAPATGTLKIFINTGESHPVGTVLGVID